jgi:hypothetical protein
MALSKDLRINQFVAMPANEVQAGLLRRTAPQQIIMTESKRLVGRRGRR